MKKITAQQIASICDQITDIVHNGCLANSPKLNTLPVGSTYLTFMSEKSFLERISCAPRAIRTNILVRVYDLEDSAPDKAVELVLYGQRGTTNELLLLGTFYFANQGLIKFTKKTVGEDDRPITELIAMMAVRVDAFHDLYEPLD